MQQLNHTKHTIISSDIHRLIDPHRQRFTVPDHMGKSQNQTHTHYGEWHG